MKVSLPSTLLFHSRTENGGAITSQTVKERLRKISALFARSLPSPFNAVNALAHFALLVLKLRMRNLHANPVKHIHFSL